MRRTHRALRIGFVILALLCLFGAVSASLVGAMEHHEPLDGPCLICLGLSLREHLLDLMLGCVVAAFVCLLSVSCATVGGCYVFAVSRTPVRLKVKLLN